MVVVWLVVVTVAAVSWLTARTVGPGGAPALVAFLVLAAIGLGALAVLLVRGARGIASPLGDLIDAAARVEGGDYSTRVPEARRAPRPMRALARAFNTMTARLETDERQRRELLAEISHELRTPLAVLQGELEAMLDGVHPLDQAHLSATLEETRVLTRLVDDLRTLTLAEAGTLALHRESTDLAVLAEEVASAFGQQADEAGVRIRPSVSEGIPLLDVDPVRIREVLANLVTNALRYAPAGSEIRIEAELVAPVSKGAVWIAVSDAGPGISPDLLPHVFDRFTKAPMSRGSGLGLAIARQIVEAHGGTIGARSAPGEGTTISFDLPIESRERTGS